MSEEDSPKGLPEIDEYALQELLRETPTKFVLYQVIRALAEYQLQLDANYCGLTIRGDFGDRIPNTPIQIITQIAEDISVANKLIDLTGGLHATFDWRETGENDQFDVVDIRIIMDFDHPDHIILYHNYHDCMFKALAIQRFSWVFNDSDIKLTAQIRGSDGYSYPYTSPAQVDALAQEMTSAV